LFWTTIKRFNGSDSNVFLLFLGVVIGVKLFKVTKGASGVETLGASEGAHTDLVALTELHVSSKLLKSLVSVLIARVNNPSVGLHEDGRTEIVLGMPPVTGAGGLATSAQDTLVKSVE